MSIFNDKALKGVAEAAAKIMAETSHELKGNQHKIDANKNGKIDAHDFKLLRAKKDMKKEEVELDEATEFTPKFSFRQKVQPHINKHLDDDKVAGAHTSITYHKQPTGEVHAHVSYRNISGKTVSGVGPTQRKKFLVNKDHTVTRIKEEVEQLDEVGDTPAGRKALGSYVTKAIADKTKDRTKGLRKATSRMYKDNYYDKKTNEEVELHEETEQLQEYESKGGVFRHSAKLEKGSQYGSSDYSKGGEEEKEAKKLTSSPKRAQKGYGPRQNTGMRGLSIPGLVKADGSKVKKEELSFTEMLELYNEHGLKVLAPIETEEMDIDGTTIEVIDGDKINGYVETIVEEPTNDEFTKEYEDQKASFEGKKKQPKVAAGKTTGVKIMPEEIEQIDERELSTGETKKKEEYVKGMKKGLSGFKQRYGERAKEVMYATATKMAKKD